MPAFVSDLKSHGWTYIKVDSCIIDKLANWQNIFQNAFNQEEKNKLLSGKYRSEKGVTLGYRKEIDKEFFETRMNADGAVSPHFPAVDCYEEVVSEIMTLYASLASIVITAIAKSLGIDPYYFLDLTDIPDSNSNHSKNVALNVFEDELSSTLLRICHYPSPSPSSSEASPKILSFGSHTDTSLLTFGLLSSSPGLEVLDNARGSWVCVEEAPSTPDIIVVVLVGEFLQVLIKSRFPPAVHRVMNSSARISCPGLVRCRPAAVVSSLRRVNRDGEPLLHHPEAALPQLEGVEVRTLQRLLDLKRQQCMRRHRDSAEDWVLRAYSEG